MKFRIGDKVKIDINNIGYFSETWDSKIMSKDNLPKWYSESIYTVKGFDDKNLDVIFLDKNLPNSGNKINAHYLKLLKIERKKKLLKLLSI